MVVLLAKIMLKLIVELRQTRIDLTDQVTHALDPVLPDAALLAQAGHDIEGSFLTGKVLSRQPRQGGASQQCRRHGVAPVGIIRNGDISQARGILSIQDVFMWHNERQVCLMHRRGIGHHLTGV